ALTRAPHCERVEAVDISADAVKAIAANAARNGRQNIDAREAKVFDDPRHRNPPAFAKNKASVPKALAGYKEINLRAMRLLNPGGCLITCSCSYHVHEADLEEILADAAAERGGARGVVE